MLAKRIIPCLDVRAGRVVKGAKFQNIMDVDDPVLLAEKYSELGADELVFYDITASNEERDIFIDVVEKTAEQVHIPFTVGGGIRTIEDFRNVLKAGADKVSVNSAAVKNPDLIREALKSSATNVSCFRLMQKNVTTENGQSLSMVAASTPEWMRLNGL